MSKQVFNELSMNTGFNILESFAFGGSYAKTLYQWLETFSSREQEVKALGFSDEFIRKWQFYLSYCIAGFTTEQTDVVQFTLQRPKETHQ